jgi:hypothetical protein
VIHGVWAKDSDGKFYILWHRGKQQNRILGEAIPAEASEMQRIALEIASIAEGLIIWWNARKIELSAP